MTPDLPPPASPEAGQLADRELFTHIWLQPRRVFRFLEDWHYDKYLPLLLILAGIRQSFEQSRSKNAGDVLSLWAIIGLCILLGGLTGWLGSYLYAAFVRYTGRWLGGQATTRSALRVIAYSSIPSVFSLLLFIPQIAIFGQSLFQKGGLAFGGNLAANLLLALGISLQVGLGLWSFLLMLVGISEIQRFSIWRALANLVLSVVLMVVSFMAIITVAFFLYKSVN